MITNEFDAAVQVALDRALALSAEADAANRAGISAKLRQDDMQRNLDQFADRATLAAAEGKNSEVRAALARQMLNENTEAVLAIEEIAVLDEQVRIARISAERAERDYRIALAEIAYWTARLNSPR